VQVCIVNPLAVKNFGKSKLLRVKTDAADAALIAAFGQAMNPTPWQPPQPSAVALRQALQSLALFKKQRTALVCQLKAFLHDPAKDDILLAMLQEDEKHLKRRIRLVNKRIAECLETHYAALAKALDTIPGVGVQTTALLVAVTDGFLRFDSAKQLACYIGIAPRVIQSGKMAVRAPSIFKIGLDTLRHNLYICALSAVRFNAPCRHFFLRLREKGKAMKVVLTAVAHKLLKIAFAVAKSGKSFDPNFISTNSQASLAC
jgi:transposase